MSAFRLNSRPGRQSLSASPDLTTADHRQLRAKAISIWREIALTIDA
jgi:hypothetical protein